MVLCSLHRRSPASPTVFMYLHSTEEFLCRFDSRDAYFIAPSSFPGLPIFLPRCETSQTLETRVYVSIDGQWVMDRWNYTTTPCKAVLEGRGFYPIFLMKKIYRSPAMTFPAFGGLLHHLWAGWVLMAHLTRDGGSKDLWVLVLYIYCSYL
jgi:hypothetical protein